MGKICLKQYHNHHKCCWTSNIVTFNQISNFPNTGLKYHLPRVQSPVCPLPLGGLRNFLTLHNGEIYKINDIYHFFLKHTVVWMENPENYIIIIKESQNLSPSCLNNLFIYLTKNGLGILLKHHYSNLGTPLEHPWDTFAISLTHLASNALNSSN